MSQYTQSNSLKVWQARKNIKQLWPIELPSSIALKPLQVCRCHTETISHYCKHEAQVKSSKWNSPSRICFFLIPGLWRWWYGWRFGHKGTGSSHCWHCHPWDPQQTDRKARRYQQGPSLTVYIGVCFFWGSEGRAFFILNAFREVSKKYFCFWMHLWFRLRFKKVLFWCM